jgi:MFS family permease
MPHYSGTLMGRALVETQLTLRNCLEHHVALPPTVAVTLWSRPYRALSIGALMLVAQSAFEYIAVATAMPTVARSLHGLNLYALAFGAPLAAAIVATVASGRWCDRYGPRKPLWSGVLVFVAGLLMAGLAPTMALLVVGRAMQGFGAGVLYVALYVIVGRVYPQELRPRVFAAFAAAWVLPSVIGPGIAGLLVQFVSWRAVFLGAVLLTIPSALLVLPALRGIGAPPSERAQPSDSTRGRMLWALAAGFSVALLHVAGQMPGRAGALLMSGALVAAFCSAQRLLPPGTLALRRGLPTVIALRGLAAGAFFGAEAFVPLMMTTERGLSPALAGSALTIGALGWAAGSWYEGRQATPSARCSALRRGMMAMVAGIAAQPILLIPGAPLFTSIVGWGVAGLGMGMMYPILSTLTLELSPVKAQGANSSALQLADAMAASSVLALGGALLARPGAAIGRETYLTCFAAAAGLAVIGALGASRVGAAHRN